MAKCFPEPYDAVSESKAELLLYKALAEQLGPDYVILHSVAWISRPGGSGPREGETDILIAHPVRGLLALEVKGGRVSLDYRTRTWVSIDANGVAHDIKNPFDQARRGKFALLEKLKESPAWKKLGIGRFNIGYAVFVPNVGDGDRLRGPDAPAEMIGDRRDLSDLGAWVGQVLDYWSGQEGAGQQIGTRGVDALVALFARSVSTRPLLSARIADEEDVRFSLTIRQAAILDILRRQRRVVIAGGAGTGKTLIAREKAVRLASEGMRTLLLCYNRGLADHLREQCTTIGGLDVATFHQVCHRWIERVKAKNGRDLLSEARANLPRGDEFDHHMPMALANAVDTLGPIYDAIVVDEAQDFGDEFWLPVEMLLTRPDEAMLYVFLDENQDIYRRSAEIPVQGEPMVLDRNCRNTDAIHAAAYSHYRGAVVEPPQISGVEVNRLLASGIEKQAALIGTLVTKLVVEEGVAPHEIAILLCDPADRPARERALQTLPLPATVKLGRVEDFSRGGLTVDTVARFKGLERAVVILWAFDRCDVGKDRETLYVGMSRAKSLLYVVGSREACDHILAAQT
ncbi:superfamily I DNA and RNA helicase [Hoeflea marina]|uniref:DNA 3'-5' helicase II n=1 Tax=Hoeflea marina TaxID=274592 RepID=A0A317PS96_9HYPH|nr:nuclease-related domain-containing DEAD/DEAH box helicase [Hoeflea marina]PWW03827.1 superfamily I DNA and RNA helicase [Hoeflea marina]